MLTSVANSNIRDEEPTHPSLYGPWFFFFELNFLPSLSLSLPPSRKLKLFAVMDVLEVG
jgi:hypothetical protein